MVFDIGKIAKKYHNGGALLVILTRLEVRMKGKEDKSIILVRTRGDLRSSLMRLG